MQIELTEQEYKILVDCVERRMEGLKHNLVVFAGREDLETKWKFRLSRVASLLRTLKEQRQ